MILLLGTLSGCKLQKENGNIFLAEELLQQGNIRKADKMARELLASGRLTVAANRKLDSIVDLCQRIRIDYTLTEEDLLKKLKSYDSSLTKERLMELEKEHKVDFRMLDGQKSYFKNCFSNLFRLDAACSEIKCRKEGRTVDSLSIFRQAHSKVVTEMAKTSGTPVLPVRMKLSYTITVKAGSVPAGDTIRCWMPYPRDNNPRQTNIELIGTHPEKYLVSPASDLQRSIYFEQLSQSDQPARFHCEFSYTSFAQPFYLTPEAVKPYRTELASYKEFTAERAPQIVFNDKIKTLANRILQGETNPLLKVRKIYHWINDSVTWASALEYSIIPDIPGFVIDNRHGDCGMQTLLFMTLARYSGVPVKWQSGWMLHPGHVNLHDWCEVYYEGIGWVPLDQSFGLQDSQDEKIRDFYITGMDSYRLIVNDDYGRPLSPPKKYLRSEPYDFQRGEIEWKGGNLYFDKWTWHMEVTYEPKSL